MSDLGSSNWSETAASNNATPPNGWPAGMNGSQVEPASREEMAALKRLYGKTNPVYTTGGTSTAYTLTSTTAEAAYYAGQLYSFIINQACGASPTLNIDGLGAIAIRKWTGASFTAIGAGELQANQVVIAKYNSSGPGFDIVTASFATTGPTVQTFTSGSAATYTTPAGAKWLWVRMIGGGGGGGGSGNSSGGTGGTGGNTIFNSVNAAGGVGGGGNGSGAAGTGGTGGSGSATNRVPGSPGNIFLSPTGWCSGGQGAQGLYGGGAGLTVGVSGSSITGGGAAASNTGAGGAGSSGAPSIANGGFGGGSGEYVELIINNPSSTYTYTVGAAGTGGTASGSNNAPGGAGGSGIIIVQEHYNFG